MGIEEYFYNSIVVPGAVFSKKELFSSFCEAGYQKSESSFLAYFQKLINEARVQRVGRNAYCAADTELVNYRYNYSRQASLLATAIKNRHPYLNFSIFEMFQLNEFVNHQIGRNTIFVFVDADVIDYVFDSLKTIYSGNILLKPTEENYHRYKTDDTVILCRRISEAPMGYDSEWSTCIEKLLVDIIAEPLIVSSYDSNETARIYESVFDKYIIDESRMFRYARRRNAEGKIRALIAEKTSIKLHT